MAALFCVTLHLLMSGRGRPSPPTQIAGNAPNFTHLCSSVVSFFVFAADVEQAPRPAFHG